MRNAECGITILRITHHASRSNNTQYAIRFSPRSKPMTTANIPHSAFRIPHSIDLAAVRLLAAQEAETQEAGTPLVPLVRRLTADLDTPVSAYLKLVAG